MSYLSDKYQRLFDLAGDGILLIQNEKFIDCNPRAAEILGYESPSELIGRYPYEISPEVQPDGSLSREYAFLLTKAAYRSPTMFEWVHHTKSGDPRVIEVTLTLFDKDQEILLVHWRDISNRKDMEKEILSKASMLERTGRLAKVGGWEYKNGELLISRQTARILHLADAGTYSLRQVLKIFTRQSVRLLFQSLRELMRTQISSRVKLETKTIYGCSLWLRVSSEIIDQDEGRFCIAGAVQDITEIALAQLKRETREKEIKQGHFQLMQAMSLAMDKRDPYTAGHQNRVAELSLEIAREMGLDEQRIEGLVLGATLHDLGKIAIPAEILTRPGKISSLELELIKRHALIGFEIIQDVSFPWPINQMVKHHHERMDGTGYPDGLKGEEILLEARIIAVADVVEAMASSRPYRNALGIDIALEEIRKNRAVLYDPDVVDACIKVLEDGYQI